MLKIHFSQFGLCAFALLAADSAFAQTSVNLAVGSPALACKPAISLPAIPSVPKEKKFRVEESLTPPRNSTGELMAIDFESAHTDSLNKALLRMESFKYSANPRPREEVYKFARKLMSAKIRIDFRMRALKIALAASPGDYEATFRDALRIEDSNFQVKVLLLAGEVLGNKIGNIVDASTFGNQHLVAKAISESGLDADLRLQALKIVAQGSLEIGEQLFWHILLDRNEYFRAKALPIILEVLGEKAIPILKDAYFYDSAEQVRFEALRLLSGMKPSPETSAVIEDAINYKLDIGVEDSAAVRQRSMAVRSLNNPAYSDMNLPILAKALNDAEPKVRIAAIDAISDSLGWMSSEFIAPLLNAPSKEVRKVSLLQLILTQKEGALKYFEAILNSERLGDAGLALYVLQRAGESPDSLIFMDQLEPFYQAAIQHPSEEIVLLALKGAARRFGQASLPLFERVLRSTRFAAIEPFQKVLEAAAEGMGSKAVPLFIQAVNRNQSLAYRNVAISTAMEMLEYGRMAVLEEAIAQIQIELNSINTTFGSIDKLQRVLAHLEVLLPHTNTREILSLLNSKQPTLQSIEQLRFFLKKDALNPSGNAEARKLLISSLIESASTPMDRDRETPAFTSRHNVVVQSLRNILEANLPIEDKLNLLKAIVSSEMPNASKVSILRTVLRDEAALVSGTAFKYILESDATIGVEILEQEYENLTSGRIKHEIILYSSNILLSKAKEERPLTPATAKALQSVLDQASVDEDPTLAAAARLAQEKISNARKPSLSFSSVVNQMRSWVRSFGKSVRQ